METRYIRDLLAACALIFGGVIAYELYFYDSHSLDTSAVFFEKNNVTPKKTGSTEFSPSADSAAPPLTPSLNQLKKTRSLAGTMVADNLQLTENNELIVTKDVIDLFDYFLFASGEIQNEVIEQGTREYLKSRLPEPALSSVLEILDNYMAYITAQEAINTEVIRGLNPNSIQNIDPYEALKQPTLMREEMLPYLSESLNHIKKIRRKHMGDDVVEAIWHEDELYDEYTLHRLTILSDPTLSEGEKTVATKVLKEQLPEHIQKANEGPVSHDSIASSLNQDMSAEEAYQQNVERFGPEAAERLSQLGERRSRFHNQYEIYNKKRKEIIQSGLSTLDQMDAIDNLRRRHFSDQQVKRVTTMDRISHEG